MLAGAAFAMLALPALATPVLVQSNPVSYVTCAAFCGGHPPYIDYPE
jgi:hypothetical protein